MRSPLRLHRSSLGGSLAEGLVVMTIGVLFLSVLPGFYLTYVKIWQRETTEMGVVQRGDFALRRMHEDVRSARSALLSSDGTILTLTLPKKAYDAALGRNVNALDSQGQLIDGDKIKYYIVQDSYSVGGSAAAMYRRIIHPDGTAESPRIVADHLCPGLNPLDSGTGHPQPLFTYNPALHIVTVTVTAAELKPSTGTFAPTQSQVRCSRDHGSLVRVCTPHHPEGEIQCTICGTHARPTAGIQTYQTQLLLRNG